jgi:hypothetical protein
VFEVATAVKLALSEVAVVKLAENRIEVAGAAVVKLALSEVARR